MTSRSNSDWVGSLSDSGGTCTDTWERLAMHLKEEAVAGLGAFFFSDAFDATCIIMCCVHHAYHLRWEFVVLDFKAAVELERRRCSDSGMLSDQLGIASRHHPE